LLYEEVMYPRIKYPPLAVGIICNVGDVPLNPDHTLNVGSIEPSGFNLTRPLEGTPLYVSNAQTTTILSSGWI
jgi:hypothetical protein